MNEGMNECLLAAKPTRKPGKGAPSPLTRVRPVSGAQSGEREVRAESHELTLPGRQGEAADLLSWTRLGSRDSDVGSGRAPRATNVGVTSDFTGGNRKEVWWEGRHLLGRETRVHGCLSCGSVGLQ